MLHEKAAIAAILSQVVQLPPLLDTSMEKLKAG
jgi:hypothetical protein